MRRDEELARALRREIRALELAAERARKQGLYGAERTLLHVLSHLKVLLEGLEGGEPRF
jgi:hypothetical protein